MDDKNHLFVLNFFLCFFIIRHAFRWHVWCLLWGKVHERAPCIKEEINLRKYDSFYVLSLKLI